MDYISVAEFAKKFGIAERTVRNYCSNGKIPGAVLVGKTWSVPCDAELPQRGAAKRKVMPLLVALKEQKDAGLKGGIYHRTQVDLTYNSNHIEGSRLTHEQTRFIYETNTIGVEKNAIRIDDIIETTNHFRCIDFIIDNAEIRLNEGIIKKLHSLLKSGTSDSSKDWFAVGEYKRLPNEVGGNDNPGGYFVKKEMIRTYYMVPTSLNMELGAVTLLDATIKVEARGIKSVFAGLTPKTENTIEEILLKTEEPYR